LPPLAGFFEGVLEPVQSLAEGRIAALERHKKYSRTVCSLRFFVQFRLALHPLIETLNRFLERDKNLNKGKESLSGHYQ
jgi:hypothetical protein